MSNRWRNLTASSVVCALALAASAHAAQVNRVIALAEYERTRADEDREMIFNPAGAVCQVGFKTRQYANPGSACAVAHKTALRAGLYDHALAYSVIGCRKYQIAADCSRAGALPLALGNRGVAVPASFAAEVKSAAEFVCLSGASVRDSAGADVTGAQCNHLARQFRLAKDPAYAFELQPAARQYFETTEDLALAGTLHLAACQRHRHMQSCRQARVLGMRVDERAIKLAQQGNGRAETAKSAP